MSQEFKVEKNNSRSHSPRPWCVRCTRGEGPFPAHIYGYFANNKSAQICADAYNGVISKSLKKSVDKSIVISYSKLN